MVRLFSLNVAVAIIVLPAICGFAQSHSDQQQQPPTASAAANSTEANGDHVTSTSNNDQGPAGADVNNATKEQVADLSKKVDDLSDELTKQSKVNDFALVLGIGSLIGTADASDYTDQSNILAATNLGRSSPQYLVGASFRVPVQWWAPFSRHVKWEQCYPVKTSIPDGKAATANVQAISDDPRCQVWRLHPWSGFLSLKFASNSSQTLSGYVVGGTYQIAPYLSIASGFGITPFMEPGQGLRVTASQYVTAQQAQGNLLNFDPVAMLHGSRNAFDGFSLVDANQKLIYSGTPLETHYHGGWLIGVSVPLSFGSVFSNSSK